MRACRKYYAGETRPVRSVSVTQAVSVTGNRVDAGLFGSAGRDAVGH